MQQENETVQQWWHRKLDKGQECNLENYTQGYPDARANQGNPFPKTEKRILKRKRPYTGEAVDDRQQLAKVSGRRQEHGDELHRQANHKQVQKGQEQ